MHHALEIQEILLNIFDHCGWNSDLVSLAGTCRTFKEPALDLLWEQVDDLFPLVSCLSEAFRQVSDVEYSLIRPLTQLEWDTLLSYTRRIRYIHQFDDDQLDNESLRTILSPPTTEPLFPNLISLLIVVGDRDKVEQCLGLVPKSSPNVRNLTFDDVPFDAAFSKLAASCICQWQNLQSLTCPRIALDVDALMHLSRMLALKDLQSSLSRSLPAFDAPLSFLNLHSLTLQSDFWDLISHFLSGARLPVITYFLTAIGRCPSKQELSSFWASLWTSTAGHHTIASLCLTQSHSFLHNSGRQEALLLGLEDLQPCMAFKTLRWIKLSIPWSVALTDTDLLTLASAWPKVEQLVINAEWGWNMHGGITPSGFLRLFQACPSLGDVALAVDTQGYTDSPPGDSLSSLGTTSARKIRITALDSVIEAESVPAVAAFFAGFATYSSFSFFTWKYWQMIKPRGWEVYMERWNDVLRRVQDDVAQGSHL